MTRNSNASPAKAKGVGMPTLSRRQLGVIAAITLIALCVGFAIAVSIVADAINVEPSTIDGHHEQR